MVGAYPDEDRNVLVIFGMWVDPEGRRSGVGRRLLGEVIEWAARLRPDRTAAPDT
jgi:GNAT superfamily N-acetyltransferase